MAAAAAAAASAAALAAVEPPNFPVIAVGDRVRKRSPNPLHGRIGIVIEIFDQGLTGLPKVRRACSLSFRDLFVQGNSPWRPARPLQVKIRLADGQMLHYACNQVDHRPGPPPPPAPADATAATWDGSTSEHVTEESDSDSEVDSDSSARAVGPPSTGASRLPKLKPKAPPPRGKRVQAAARARPARHTALPKISASRNPRPPATPPPPPFPSGSESFLSPPVSPARSSPPTASPPLGELPPLHTEPAPAPGDDRESGLGPLSKAGVSGGELEAMEAVDHATAILREIPSESNPAGSFTEAVAHLSRTAHPPSAGSSATGPRRSRAGAGLGGGAPAPLQRGRSRRRVLSPSRRGGAWAEVHVCDLGDVETMGDEAWLWLTAVGRHPRGPRNRHAAVLRIRAPLPRPPTEPLLVRGDAASPRHRFLIVPPRRVEAPNLAAAVPGQPPAIANPLRSVVSAATQTDPPPKRVGAQELNPVRPTPACGWSSHASSESDGETRESVSSEGDEWAPPQMVLFPPPWALRR